MVRRAAFEADGVGSIPTPRTEIVNNQMDDNIPDRRIPGTQWELSPEALAQLEQLDRYLGESAYRIRELPSC